MNRKLVRRFGEVESSKYLRTSSWLSERLILVHFVAPVPSPVGNGSVSAAELWTSGWKPSRTLPSSFTFGDCPNQRHLHPPRRASRAV